MHLRLDLGLHQKQELKLAQEVRPLEGNWLTGDPRDLETLLKTHPQVDDDQLHYLIAGGWAVELLTGKSREHHDLDVINLSKIPLNYQLDLQEPKDYFGVLSYTAEELFDNFVETATWNPPKETGKRKKQYTVHVTAPTYLFMSKLAGFIREPRDKDYDDLAALSTIIQDTAETKAQFIDLLKHIPSLHYDFEHNNYLFKDLLSSPTGVFDTYSLAAEYLLEMVHNFNKQPDLGRKQAARFHATLKKVYDKGLEDALSMQKENLEPRLYEKAWFDKELDGFWTKNGEIDLKVFPTAKNKKTLKKLHLWQDLEKKFSGSFSWFTSAKIISLEDYTEELKIGAFEKIQQGKQYVVIVPHNDIAQAFTSAGIIKIDDLYAFPSVTMTDNKIYTAKGELLLKTNVGTDMLGANYHSFLFINDLFVAGELDNFETLCKHFGRNPADTTQVRDMYKYHLASGSFEEAEKLQARFPTNPTYLEFMHIDLYKAALKQDNTTLLTFLDPHLNEHKKSMLKEQQYTYFILQQDFTHAAAFEQKHALPNAAALRESALGQLILNSVSTEQNNLDKILSLTTQFPEIVTENTKSCATALIKAYQDKIFKDIKNQQNYVMYVQFNPSNYDNMMSVVKAFDLSPVELLTQSERQKIVSAFVEQISHNKRWAIPTHAITAAQDLEVKPWQRELLNIVKNNHLTEENWWTSLIPRDWWETTTLEKAYLLTLQGRHPNRVAAIKAYAGFADDIDQQLFFKYPEKYCLRKTLEKVKIDVNAETQAAVLEEIKKSLFGGEASGGRQHSSRINYLIDYFKLEKEKVKELIISSLGEYLDNHYAAEFKTKALRFEAAGFLEKTTITELVQKKVAEYEQKQDYYKLVSIARDILKDPTLERQYAIKSIEQLPEGSTLIRRLKRSI